MKFKIGDNVRLKAGEQRSDWHLPEGVITRISHNYFLHFGGSTGWDYTRYELVLIDWTKPIRMVMSKTPLKLVGEWNGRRVVATSTVLFSVNENGVKFCGPPCVENVPPPPIWPMKKWFVTFESDNIPRVSGPANSLEAAEKNAASLRINHKNVIIQEVSFGLSA